MSTHLLQMNVKMQKVHKKKPNNCFKNCLSSIFEGVTFDNGHMWPVSVLSCISCLHIDLS